MCTSSVFGSFYNLKAQGKKDPAPLYNMLQLAVVFLGWLILFITDFSFDIKVIPYAIGFGCCYAIAAICTILALRTGPITLSSLFLQMSLIAVTIWGFFFWD
jgi:drug/metabolite transporter (DMT)-like permease